MIDFKVKLEENSREIDRFLDHNLPFGNGLNAKLFEANISRKLINALHMIK